ncbi:MAG: right-handed parallel beta-helix repeat-containing protein [Limisphaerales bacterium]
MGMEVGTRRATAPGIFRSRPSRIGIDTPRGLLVVAGLIGITLGGPSPGHAASRLKWSTPHLEASGALRFWVAGTDESEPITPERSSRIEILTSRDPAEDPGSWRILGGSTVLTQGMLRLDHTPEAGSPRGFFLAREASPTSDVTVRDAAGLRSAVAAARPGTRILLAPGVYPGGFSFAGLRGATNSPIVLAGADPSQPPVIQGGANGIQLTDPAFVEIRDIHFGGATGNGLNIDDGGTFDTPARHVTLRRLVIRDVGPQGNRDGIKLSGVVSFRVEQCTVERWGTGGSAVDMVGCHDGLILSNVFRHLPATASEAGNGVQTKGGSRNIVVRRNRFEHSGSRGVNIGGSTGLEFFRPPLGAAEGRWEAKDIQVEGNTFVGTTSPVAFVGVDGAEVRFNTIHRPGRWAIRILQETTVAGFVPCRNGRFSDNLVVFHSSQWSAGGVNVGGGTAPNTFQFARNAWYCLDQPSRSRPTLPVAENNGTYGAAPIFMDAATGDFRQTPESPTLGVGADALP